MSAPSKEQSKVDDANSKAQRSSFINLYPQTSGFQLTSVSEKSTPVPLMAPPPAKPTSQLALEPPAQRAPQQEDINQGTSNTVANNESVWQIAPSPELPPQLLSSHSRKTHNRPTTKRPSASLDQGSPSKRQRAGDHNAQVGSMHSQPTQLCGQPPDQYASFPRERAMNSSVQTGFNAPAGSNVPNGFRSSAVGNEWLQNQPPPIPPHASGNIGQPPANLTPSRPLPPDFFNSPQRSQRHSRIQEQQSQHLQEHQARPFICQPLPPSDFPSQIAGQSEPQNRQANIVRAEHQDRQNNNPSEQTQDDSDDFFTQFMNLDEAAADNAEEEVR
jgi:hypothetical protein